jgi:hypothetical protein
MRVFSFDLLTFHPRLYHAGATITAMPRPIQAFVHSDALRNNLARMRAAAPDSRVWAVVKANAYGHGIERVLCVAGLG